jgi:hypothetical protein
MNGIVLQLCCVFAWELDDDDTKHHCFCYELLATPPMFTIIVTRRAWMPRTGHEQVAFVLYSWPHGAADRSQAQAVTLGLACTPWSVELHPR